MKIFPPIKSLPFLVIFFPLQRYIFLGLEIFLAVAVAVAVLGGLGGRYGGEI